MKIHHICIKLDLFVKSHTISKKYFLLIFKMESTNVLTELRYYNMKLATQRKFHEMR